MKKAKSPFAPLPKDPHLYFNWVEVATALLKLKDIHEGWWRVGVQFDGHGASVKIPTGAGQFTLVPAIMAPILNVNLKPVDEQDIDPLCVNAAVVNPKARLIVPSSYVN